MSIAAMTWAFGLELRPSTLKFLLVALADAADDKGTCFPSVAALISKTSQDRKTVIGGIDELERIGLLADTGHRVGRTQQVKVYRLSGFDNGDRHYTYRVSDPVTGEFYIGVRTCFGEPDRDIGYMGSGNWPLAAMRAQRRLVKHVLMQYSSRREAESGERELIGRYCPDPLCRNDTKNGTGTKFGTVPNFPLNSTEIPSKESRFSAQRVPKTEHGTVSEPSIEPSVNRGESRKRSSAPATLPAVSVPSQGQSTEAAVERGPRVAKRLPEDFALTPARKQVAVEEGIDPERTFAKFTDHWAAASGSNARKHNWDAAWRNWCRGEVDRRPRGGGMSTAARSTWVPPEMRDAAK